MQEKTGTSEVSKEIYESTEKVVADLKTKWEGTDEKPAVIVLGVVALVALWVLNGVATALESLPLFSGLFQLVGIFVTGWFTYRYLVFAPGMSLSPAFGFTVHDTIASLTSKSRFANSHSHHASQYQYISTQMVGVSLGLMHCLLRQLACVGSYTVATASRCKWQMLQVTGISPRA